MILSKIVYKMNSINKLLVINNVNKNIRSISSTSPKRISMTEYDRLTDRILNVNKNVSSLNDQLNTLYLNNDRINKKMNLILKQKNRSFLFSINTKYHNRTNNKFCNDSIFSTLYYLDFDGNPFFRLPTNYAKKYFDNKFSSKFNTKYSIYNLSNNISENLIIYGITNELYSVNDINRLNWIVNNYNKDKDNDDIYVKNSRYFKMNLMNKIEFITYNQNKKCQIEYNLYDFKSK
mgnify:CR=1 FL=1|jgi:hypothetical protein